MRTVFENDQVGHLWANQSQGNARSHNGNFWFEGLAIYSYRTKIAQFTADPSGTQPIALITSHTYSVTTSGKHMPAIRRALRAGMLAFTVPELGNVRGELTAKEHANNAAYLASQYHGYLGKVRRQRSPLDTWQRQHLHELALRVRDYHRSVMGEAGYVFACDPDKDFDEIERARTLRDQDPKRAEILAKRAREKEARKAREARAREEREREARTKWLAGEGYWRGTLANGSALLRVRGDTLETSQGAQVPLAHAVKAFRMVKRCRDAAINWRRNGATLRVGHFQVDSIDANGNMIAGCHRIDWPEIERVAREVGVFDTVDTGDVSDVLENAHA